MNDDIDRAILINVNGHQAYRRSMSTLARGVRWLRQFGDLDGRAGEIETLHVRETNDNGENSRATASAPQFVRPPLGYSYRIVDNRGLASVSRVTLMQSRVVAERVIARMTRSDGKQDQDERLTPTIFHPNATPECYFENTLF